MVNGRCKLPHRATPLTPHPLPPLTPVSGGVRSRRDDPTDIVAPRRGGRGDCEQRWGASFEQCLAGSSRDSHSPTPHAHARARLIIVPASSAPASPTRLTFERAAVTPSLARLSDHNKRGVERVRVVADLLHRRLCVRLHARSPLTLLSPSPLLIITLTPGCVEVDP